MSDCSISDCRLNENIIIIVVVVDVVVVVVFVVVVLVVDNYSYTKER